MTSVDDFLRPQSWGYGTILGVTSFNGGSFSTKSRQLPGEGVTLCFPRAVFSILRLFPLRLFSFLGLSPVVCFLLWMATKSISHHRKPGMIRLVDTNNLWFPLVSKRYNNSSTQSRALFLLGLFVFLGLATSPASPAKLGLGGVVGSDWEAVGSCWGLV